MPFLHRQQPQRRQQQCLIRQKLTTQIRNQRMNQLRIWPQILQARPGIFSEDTPQLLAIQPTLKK